MYDADHPARDTDEPRESADPRRWLWRSDAPRRSRLMREEFLALPA
jgi:hypothetical protein